MPSISWDLCALGPVLGAARDTWLMGAPGLGLQVWLRPGVQEGNEQSALGKGRAWGKAGRKVGMLRAHMGEGQRAFWLPQC